MTDVPRNMFPSAWKHVQKSLDSSRNMSLDLSGSSGFFIRCKRWHAFNINGVEEDKSQSQLQGSRMPSNSEVSECWDLGLS